MMLRRGDSTGDTRLSVVATTADAGAEGATTGAGADAGGATANGAVGAMLNSVCCCVLWLGRISTGGTSCCCC